MGQVVVRTLAVDEQQSAIDTLVLAFASDPMARWSWPSVDRYMSAFPRMVLAFGGAAFDHQSAFATDDFGAVALWLPPSVHPDEDALGAISEQTVAEPRLSEANAIFEQMARRHPDEPHWYLPLIGTDPAHQGRGQGTALMAYALAECDRQRVPAYLESSNPRNISLYQRHGFEALAPIQVGSSPPVVPMLRKAR
jgi:ribosomal protein S18 acetylase RimI-like enzyme